MTTVFGALRKTKDVKWCYLGDTYNTAVNAIEQIEEFCNAKSAGAAA